MQGYQASHLQDGRGSTWKEEQLNYGSKQDFISITSFVIIVPILKGVRIYSKLFSFSLFKWFIVV